MRIVFIAATAAAALTSTIGMARAPAEGEQRFVHQGSTYAYTVRKTATGAQVIEGRRLPNGRSFHLVVEGERVSGTAGGMPVAFRTADARGAAAGSRID